MDGVCIDKKNMSICAVLVAHKCNTFVLLDINLSPVRNMLVANLSTLVKTYFTFFFVVAVFE